MRKNILAIAILSVSSVLFAQQGLNNDSVIKLVKAGLSDDLIVSTISASAGNYDTSAEGIIAVKSAGASDKVIAAIVTKANVPTPVPPAPAAVPASVPMPVAQPPAPQAIPAPPLFHSTDGKIRVYVTDHPMFESNEIARASGDRHGFSAAGVSHTQAGDDPRTVEIQADILKVCPAFVLASNNQDRADYVLVFRRRGGSRSSMFAFGGLTGLALSAGMKVDGGSLFKTDGDMIYATKENTVEKSIRDICDHIPAPATAPVQAVAPAPALQPIPPSTPPSN